MPRLLIIAALLSLWAAPALAADQEPWVDADRFKPSQAAPPPASAPAPAAPKATAPAPAKPDYGDQAEIQRRRKARLAYTQALDEFNAGRYQQAARLFLQHLAVFPENGQARQYLAQARRLQKAQTHGTLRVLCSPPAQVTVDGQLRGNTPLSLAEVPVGPHLVQVEAKGVRQGREVRIKPMTTVTVEFDLTPSEERIEVIRPSRNQPRAAPAPPSPAPVAKPAPPAPAAKPAPPAPAAKPAAPTAKPASPAPTSAASPAPVAQPAAPAQAAAPRGSYAAKVVPARFTPPPGWRVEENASARQVRLWPPQEGTMIQLNAANPSQGATLEQFLANWDREFMAKPNNPLKHRVKGEKLRLGPWPAYQAIYQGGNAQATMVFVQAGGRVYVFSAICLPVQCPRLEGPFWAVLESFSPLP